MEVLAFAVLIGLIPAVIARKKGRAFVGWWVYGALLLIVALPHALLCKDRSYRCLHCAEKIRPEARICPHCHTELSPPPAPVVSQRTPARLGAS
jgi:hypothetical protein